MRRKVAVLLAGMVLASLGLLSSWSDVIGQVPTSSPTWARLVVTPTPGPTKDMGCGDVVEGWGTVTPDVGWWVNCANCLLTSTAVMQSTPTPEVTSTPGYSTITPTPGGQFHLGEEVVLTAMPESMNIMVSWSHIIDPLPYDVVGAIMELVTCGDCSSRTNNDANSISAGGFYWQWYGQRVCYSGYYDSAGCDAFPFAWDTWHNADPAINLVQGSHASAYMWNGWSTAFIEWHITPIYAGSPLPTPEPGGGYCSDLVGGGGGIPEEPEPGMGYYPGPMVRPGSCATMVPAFSVAEGGIIDAILNALGINYEAIEFGGLSVCITEIQFGELDFVGVKLDLDLLVMVLAGIALVYVFLRL